MINTIVLSGRVSKAIRSNNVNGSAVVNFVGAFETGLAPKLATVDGKEMAISGFLKAKSRINYRIAA